MWWNQVTHETTITNSKERRNLQWFGYIKGAAGARWPHKIIEKAKIRTKGGRLALPWLIHFHQAMHRSAPPENNWANLVCWEEKTTNFQGENIKEEG